MRGILWTAAIIQFTTALAVGEAHPLHRMIRKRLTQPGVSLDQVESAAHGVPVDTSALASTSNIVSAGDHPTHPDTKEEGLGRPISLFDDHDRLLGMSGTDKLELATGGAGIPRSTVDVVNGELNVAHAKVVDYGKEALGSDVVNLSRRGRKSARAIQSYSRARRSAERQGNVQS